MGLINQDLDYWMGAVGVKELTDENQNPNVSGTLKDGKYLLTGGSLRSSASAPTSRP